ncbi:MAG: hypothetical protein ACKVZH_16350 [Blastocatellia bacterium]
MKKTLSLLLFLVSATSFAFSQSPESASSCQLSSAQMPAIRGIKLGMTINELIQVLYDDKTSIDITRLISDKKGYPNYGQYTLSFGTSSSERGLPYLARENFPGIDHIGVVFLDDRVTSFSIGYHSLQQDSSAPIWNSPQELIGKFAKTYKLPEPPAWFIESTWAASLTCTGFKIVLNAATSQGGSTFIEAKLLKDFASIIKARREEDMQKRREAFKP